MSNYTDNNDLFQAAKKLQTDAFHEWISSDNETYQYVTRKIAADISESLHEIEAELSKRNIL